jgi:RND family efflux transporter MFP subunit
VIAAPPTRKTLTLHSVQPAAIEAFEQTPLHPKVAGYVEQVLVDIGDRVTKDQLLLKLSVPELADERAQKEALVAQADAEQKQAVAGRTASQAAVQTAESQLAAAQAGKLRADGNHSRWKAEADRIASLVATGVVTGKLGDESANQLRAAEAAQAEAQAGIQSAEAMVAESQAGLVQTDADIAAAEARRKVAQADLARAETMLKYCEIKAPYDGVITQRSVDTQHYVSPAGGTATPLLTVASHAQVRVFASIPETEAGYVSANGPDADTAVVTVQALGGKSFTAPLTRSSWALDPANRSLKVEVDLPNPEGHIRPGMYATMQLKLAEATDAWAVPATAVFRDGAETYCAVVENGVIARRPVVTGLRVGDEFEIRSGLSAMDSVVLARGSQLKPGQSVTVAAPPPK